jgi:thiosulfate/3-mercaptopyruvate sulfurtransferase
VGRHGAEEKRELRQLYAALDKRKETIVYCHTGIRASMTAAILSSLGFQSVRVYHASY